MASQTGIVLMRRENLVLPRCCSERLTRASSEAPVLPIHKVDKLKGGECWKRWKRPIVSASSVALVRKVNLGQSEHLTFLLLLLDRAFYWSVLFLQPQYLAEGLSSLLWSDPDLETMRKKDLGKFQQIYKELQNPRVPFSDENVHCTLKCALSDSAPPPRRLRRHQSERISWSLMAKKCE